MLLLTLSNAAIVYYKCSSGKVDGSFVFQYTSTLDSAEFAGKWR